MARAGITLWGPVWSMGAKRGKDDVGDYVGFCIAAPCLPGRHQRESFKIFVRWYKSTFWPEPKQVLEVSGLLGWAEVEHRYTKGPRIRLFIRVWGPWVKPVPNERPDRAKLVGQQWRELRAPREEVSEDGAASPRNDDDGQGLSD